MEVGGPGPSTNPFTASESRSPALRPPRAATTPSTHARFEETAQRERTAALARPRRIVEELRCATSTTSTPVEVARVRRRSRHELFRRRAPAPARETCRSRPAPSPGDRFEEHRSSTERRAQWQLETNARTLRRRPHRSRCSLARGASTGASGLRNNRQRGLRAALSEESGCRHGGRRRCRRSEPRAHRWNVATREGSLRMPRLGCVAAVPAWAASPVALPGGLLREENRPRRRSERIGCDAQS